MKGSTKKSAPEKKIEVITYNTMQIMDIKQFKKIHDNHLDSFGESFTQIEYDKARRILDNADIILTDMFRDGGSLLYRTSENEEIIFPIINFDPQHPVYSPIVLYKKN